MVEGSAVMLTFEAQDAIAEGTAVTLEAARLPTMTGCISGRGCVSVR